VHRVSIDVPAGWIHKENPALLAEYWADEAGTRGVLQVSRLPNDQFDFIDTQADLGVVAAEIGTRLSGFGTASGSKSGPCAMGRFGMATFPRGNHPVILLWLTVSKTSVYLWTWLGPDPRGDEMRSALQTVLTAKSE